MIFSKSSIKRAKIYLPARRDLHRALATGDAETAIGILQEEYKIALKNGKERTAAAEKKRPVARTIKIRARAAALLDLLERVKQEAAGGAEK